MDPNISQSFQKQALEILATSCALAEATRARWFDPILACVCAQCNATALDEQATQLSNLLNKIALELQIAMANRIPHFANVSPLVPDQSSVIRLRDKMINFLKRQEKEGSKLVSVVGIHGIGGLGKSTIMYALEAYMRPLKTHSIAFVHVGEKPSKPLHELQSDLIYQLSGEYVKYQSTSHGKTGFIDCMQSLKGKKRKACIFIDDVWEKSQLRDLLPGELGGIMPPSSILIISSRKKLVVDELDSLCSLQSAEKKLHAYEEYNPDLLDVNEAEDLFVKNAASRGLNLLPAHEQLVHNIVPLCGGLPLLLVVYSSYFSSDSKRVEQEEWEAVADKLKSAKDFPDEQRVFEILKTGIDRLDSEALKEAFVDVAMFYSRFMEEKDIRHCLDEEYFLETLRQHSLIFIEEEWDGGLSVEVHDLLRTVADSLKQEKKMVYINEYFALEGDHSVLSSIDSLPSDELDKVRAAIIRNRWEPRIDRMSQLRYLQISGLLSIDSLPRNESLCCELRALKLRIDCVDEEALSRSQPDQVIPPWITHLKKIRFLQLRNVSWESFAKVELPLLNLRVLRIRYDQPPARREQLLPAFSANIGRTTKLRRLELVNCSLCDIPTWIEQLQSLTSLTISTNRINVPEGGGLVEVGASIGALTNLQELGLAGNPHLMKVSGAIGQLVKLKILDLSGHPLLQGLPDALGNMSSLEELDLSFCRTLAKLPDGFSQAKALKKINLFRCSNLTELPPSLASLVSLKWLNLSSCKALAKLPDDFSQAKALKNVDLSECSSLTELPPSLVSLTSLEKLDLQNCVALAKLPDHFSQAKALKTVNLCGCSSLTELPPSLASLVSLEELDLSYCEALAKLPDHFSQAKALKEINLRGAPA